MKQINTFQKHSNEHNYCIVLQTFCTYVLIFKNKLIYTKSLNYRLLFSGKPTIWFIFFRWWSRWISSKFKEWIIWIVHQLHRHPLLQIWTRLTITRQHTTTKTKLLKVTFSLNRKSCLSICDQQKQMLFLHFMFLLL